MDDYTAKAKVMVKEASKAITVTPYSVNKCVVPPQAGADWTRPHRLPFNSLVRDRLSRPPYGTTVPQDRRLKSRC